MAGEQTTGESSPGGQVLIYQDGALNLQVRLEGQTVWLTQRLIADLYQTSVPNINQHLATIYEDRELDPAATIQTEGSRQVSRTVDHYNLEAILAVGYRVRSPRGTIFRQWATQRLSELLVKGFVLDDERIKAGRTIGGDYFDELLARIRDIRASERRFYQKITDIYATSIDYDPTQEISIQFFKTVQNKVHWAITGQTAAEIIHHRVDAAKPNLGLTNWRGAVVRKQDMGIAKNYLTAPELAALNNLVEQYLIFAQGQAMRRVPMHMTDWVKKLDAFLAINDRAILTHAGQISHEMALAKAELAYDKARALGNAADRPVDADFDRAITQLAKLPKPPKARGKKLAAKPELEE